MTGGREALRPFARAWFFYFAAMGAYSLYAPLWFDRLGLSALAIGAIASLQSWTRVFAPYGWAWAADHGNRPQQLLQLAGALSAISSLALALTGHFGMGAVSLCVALLFVANGAVMPLTEASLAHHLNMGSGQGGAQYGRTRVWGTVGFMLSVTVFGFVLQPLGLGAWPWLVFVMWLLLAVALWQLPATGDGPHVELPAAGALQVLRRAEVAWFFTSVFLVVLAHTSIYAFFSLFMASHGAQKPLIGLLWTVGLVVEVGFFWYQGHWVQRLSPHGWLLLAGGMAALRFALMAVSEGHVAVLVVAQLTHAVTFAAQHAACVALVTRYFPGRLRGRGQALYSTIGYGASGVVGGVAGGAIIERWGFAALFWGASAVALLSVVCAERSMHRSQT